MGFLIVLNAWVGDCVTSKSTGIGSFVLAGVQIDD